MSHLESVKKLLPNETALLVTSAVNQRWLTGFDFTDGYVLITHDKSFLLTDFRYIEAARAQANDGFEIVMPDCPMLTGLGHIIKSTGMRRIAVEDATLPLADFEHLKRSFPDISFVCGGSDIPDNLREFKDSDELSKMKAAQELTDAAFEHILSYISPDKTEIDIALELEFFMRSHGAEGVAFQTIAVSGRASSMPHGVPRPVRLERGFLTMDFGAKINGYCSDMTRTVVLGKADDDMKRLYKTVLAAQNVALDALLDGERERLKLDALARNLINNAGYQGCFGHSLGHGVGMYIHEAPGLSQRAPAGAMLKEGNVVTIEPGIYISGKYGCRIEDMIAVTGQGIYNFTKSPKTLIEL